MTVSPQGSNTPLGPLQGLFDYEKLRSQGKKGLLRLKNDQLLFIASEKASHFDRIKNFFGFGGYGLKTIISWIGEHPETIKDQALNNVECLNALQKLKESTTHYNNPKSPIVRLFRRQIKTDALDDLIKQLKNDDTKPKDLDLGKTPPTDIAQACAKPQESKTKSDTQWDTTKQSVSEGNAFPPSKLKKRKDAYDRAAGDREALTQQCFNSLSTGKSELESIQRVCNILELPFSEEGAQLQHAIEDSLKELRGLKNEKFSTLEAMDDGLQHIKKFTQQAKQRLSEGVQLQHRVSDAIDARMKSCMISAHSVAQKEGLSIPEELYAFEREFDEEQRLIQKAEIVKAAEEKLRKWVENTFSPSTIAEKYTRASLQGLCCSISSDEFDHLTRQLTLATQLSSEQQEKHRDLILKIALVIANKDPQHTSLKAFRDCFQKWDHTEGLTQQEQLFLATVSETPGVLDSGWVTGTRVTHAVQSLRSWLAKNGKETTIDRVAELLLGTENTTQQRDPLYHSACEIFRQKLLEKIDIDAPIGVSALSKELSSPQGAQSPCQKITPRKSGGVSDIQLIGGTSLSYRRFLEAKLKRENLRDTIGHESARVLTNFRKVCSSIETSITQSAEEIVSHYSFRKEIEKKASTTAMPADIDTNLFKAVRIKSRELEKGIGSYSTISNEIRKELLGKVQATISELCSGLGYGVLEPDLDACSLCRYIQEYGTLPRTLSHILLSSKNAEIAETLSRLTYYHAALQSELKPDLQSIATLEDLSWLFQNLSSQEKAKRCFELIRELKQDPKFNGHTFTRQQANWGLQVVYLLQPELGKSPAPIYGPGGSGKTVSVKLFLSLLPKWGIGQGGQRIVMLSPFEQASEDYIYSKMLTEFSGKVIIPVDIDPERAVVVVDEAHLLQPDFDLYLKGPSGKEKSIGSTFLKMTATPITAPTDSKARYKAIYSTFKEQKRKLLERAEAIEQVEKEKLNELKDLCTEDLKQMMIDLRKYFESLKSIPQIQFGKNYYTNCFHRVFDDEETISKEEAFRGFLGGEKDRDVGFLGNAAVLKHFHLRQLALPYKALTKLFQAYAASQGIAKYQSVFDKTFEKWRTGAGSREIFGTGRDSTTKSSRRRSRGNIFSPRLSQKRREKAEGLRAFRYIRGKKKEFEGALKRIQDHIDRLEKEMSLVDPKEKRDQNAYLDTAILRRRCLDSIQLDQANVSLWNPSYIVSQMHAAFPKASRVQIILPFLQLDQDRIQSLFKELKEVFSGKNVHIVYRNSHTSSAELRGKDCKMSDDGVVSELDPSWIPRQDDLVVMVYDKTNKQGGDFGKLSFNPDIPSSECPQVEQITFLNLYEEGEQDPLHHLTESDLYQSLRRRRGSDSIGPKRRVLAPMEYSALRQRIQLRQKEFEKQWAVQEATSRVAREILMQAPTPPSQHIEEKSIPRTHDFPYVPKLKLHLLQSGGPAQEVSEETPVQKQAYAVQRAIEHSDYSLSQLMSEEVHPRKREFEKKIYAVLATDPLEADIAELQQEDFWAAYSSILSAERIIEWAKRYEANIGEEGLASDSLS